VGGGVAPVTGRRLVAVTTPWTGTLDAGSGQPAAAGAALAGAAPEVAALLTALPPAGGVAWIREGEGFAGWGEVARIPVGGGAGSGRAGSRPPGDRFRRAAAALAELFASAEVTDEVRGWGTGPIAFGSFTFDPGSEGSELVVPSVVLGRGGGRAWITRCGWDRVPGFDELAGHPGGLPARAGGAPGPPGAGPPASAGPPALDEASFHRAVAAAREAIRRGRLDKVVLSLQARVTRVGRAGSTAPYDLRRVLARLAAAYPSCYTFACGRFVGASPELLVRREGRSVRSVPLAGSTRRGETAAEDAALQAALLASRKDRWEHDLAVVTVVESLRPLCRRLRIDPEPSVLPLANVAHLATDVAGELAGEETALEVAGAVHPTAAVCGSPTRKALALIRELEGTHRGRYAGPVGWVGADGDGEWAIALRCAEVGATSARLFAGAGIVSESDPADELDEVRLKLRPILSALDPA
jgi:menaquinone-specific isochorismate synthase